MANRARLMFVHHANQYLLTNGYENRDGISSIVQSYAQVLQAHDAHGVPLHLHLSGTLIESIAWNCPWFFTLVKQLKDRGLLRLIGGTYSENIMPYFSEDYNRRQIAEYIEVYRRHLGDPAELELFWVPERVWQPGGALSKLIADKSLPNGGYRAVFLDQRLQFAARAKEANELVRSDVDAMGPWETSEVPADPRLLSAFQIFELSGEADLKMLPISEHLRYWIPPRDESDIARLEKLVSRLNDAGNTAQMIFADDLERTAGTAGWDQSALKRFDRLLGWAKASSDKIECAHVDLSFASSDRKLASVSGTFYELAHSMQAREDYRGWSDRDDVKEIRALLDESISKVAAAKGVELRLLALAWKHALASGYETLWHDLAADKSLRLAPWAHTLASHSREAYITLAAAEWFGLKSRTSACELLDLDRDGEPEIVLKNEDIFAVISPRFGARLTALYFLTPEGAMQMIGNPTDDWNWQTELASYMQIPPNHPGAFADDECVNDRYAIQNLSTDNEVEFVNVEIASVHLGTRKKFVLDSLSLEVFYTRAQAGRFDVGFSLSPDYLELLRNGRGGVKTTCDKWMFRAEQGKASVLAQPIDFASGRFTKGVDVGHGLTVSFRAQAKEFGFRIHCAYGESRA